ncbi:hypothetical protein EES39_36545 [Streptomyces sp. ADI92-24]|nr:hypothetical protein EES39_36545 [Streptomyces sp. ADI92-24]
MSEVTLPRGLEGMEVPLFGSVVRTARFMAAGVLALVGQPIPREGASGGSLGDDPKIQ